MMKKRNLLLGLTAAMSLAMLTGCSSGSEESGESAAENADGKIEIEFWHCMGASNGELIQELTDAFNASQDKIVVKAVHQGSYTEASTRTCRRPCPPRGAGGCSDGNRKPWRIR